LDKTFIYTLKDPITDEIKYVGKSDDPKSRLVEHLKKSKYTKTYKNNWIISLLDKDLKPILEILDVVDVDNWGFWEKTK
jgi:predicted GIY-YIG superfamily endonuclease